MNARIVNTRGFSLLEVLVSIILIGVSAAVIFPLMNWGITSTHAAQTHAEMAVRFDGATAVLRADAWRATSLWVDSQQLIAQQPDGTNIVWKIGPGDRLTRNQQAWNGLGIIDKSTFLADGGAVRLVIPVRPDGTQKSVIFPSQLLMLKGASK